MMISGLLTNVQLKEKICNCAVHTNEHIRQIEGTLINGKPVVITHDSFGFHVLIGEAGQLGSFRNMPFPAGVSAAEAAWMIVLGSLTGGA